ncbi:MAG: serine protease [Pseudohongiellaceae bacterium]|nr:serine protease [Pseudohongiellaceae bacterium]
MTPAYWSALTLHLRLRKGSFWLLAITLSLGLSSAQAQLTEQIREVEQSIVKIYTTAAAPDYFTPWRLLTPSQSNGSGSVIEGNKILTNAHVVANASYVQVQKHNDPTRYTAHVEFVSHAADLALVKVDDPEFFDDIEPLSLGVMPDPQEEVHVFGYPMGGRTLSITKGILSRVEQQVYAHSGDYLVAGQIDAAINPGNSGGPVIVDGQIVGVVMQANSGGRAENLGYFVPPSIIEHVLVDAEDGVLDGFPDLGFRTQDLESPAAKSAYGLSPDESGVLVIKVFEDSPAFGVLHENDVVLSIAGFDIAGDSTIHVNEFLQTNYKYAIDLLQNGESVELVYARNGEKNAVTLRAAKRQQSYSLVKSEAFDEVPEYYIYGGILFVPLNMNLIKRWGPDWSRAAPVSLLEARNEWSSASRRELVVALQVLAADVNLGYHDLRNWIVDTVNGQPIRDFEEFTRLLRDNAEEHIVFRNSAGYQVVVDHQQAIESEAAILQQYRVPSAWSSGLFGED